MNRVLRLLVLLVLLVASFLAVDKFASAQDTNTQILKIFQEFSQNNQWPLPSIAWNEYVSARNNSLGDLPVLLNKPLTAVKVETQFSTDPLKYSGSLVYYLPGSECWRVKVSDGEVVVYGWYNLIAIIEEYDSNDAAIKAYTQRMNEVKTSISSNDKFQSKSVMVRQSQGIEYSWLMERVLVGFDNKKTSEVQQARSWAQGRFAILLAGGYEGCPTQGPDPFTLSDQFYDLVSKYLSAPSIAPTATPTPTANLTIKGQLTDGYNHSLPNAFVRLAYGSNEEVTKTDANGNYTFTNLPGALVPGYNPQKDKIHLEILLQYLDKSPVKQRVSDPVYQLFVEKVEASQLVKITSTDINLAANNAPTTFNLDLANPKAIKSSTVPLPKLAKAGLVYYHLSQAVTLAVKLGPPLTMLPIDVVIDHADLAGEPTALAWWDGTRGTVSKPRPSINFTKRLINAPPTEIAYVAWHEFGHHFMADSYGDFLPVSVGRKTHGGYCLNNSSNDSWIEGWATFFAALVNKEVNRANDYWRITRDPTDIYDLESNLKAWHNEGLAVAGLLLDMVDTDATYSKNQGKDDDLVSISVTELWQVIAYGASAEPGSNDHIFDVLDLYANLTALKTGSASTIIQKKDLDAIFILHGFYEVDDPKGNTEYKPGIKIGWTSHNRYLRIKDDQGKETWCEAMKPRRVDPPMPGSYLSLVLPRASDNATFTVEVSYAAPNTARNYTYEFSASDVKDERIYLMLPPPEEPATVRITANGQSTTSQPIEVTSAEFWSKVPSATDKPIKSYTVSFISQPAGWVLGFSLIGVILALIILLVGLLSMRRRPILPAPVYPPSGWQNSPPAQPQRWANPPNPPQPPPPPRWSPPKK